MLVLFIPGLLRFISSMNRRGLSYKLAVNHMADYSDTEFKMLRGYVRKTPRNQDKIYVSWVTDLPDSMNWWLRGEWVGVAEGWVSGCGSSGEVLCVIQGLTYCVGIVPIHCNFCKLKLH